MPGISFELDGKHWNSGVIVVGELFSDERGHLKRFHRIEFSRGRMPSSANPIEVLFKGGHGTTIQILLSIY